MALRLKLKHHTHSGRLRPHEYTSYFPLMGLLVVVGVALTVCTVSADHPGPQAGSIGLTGSMPGKPPVTAATITAPASGQRFTTSPIDVKGSCPANTLVEIYKNDIFAGSAVCSAAGTYDFNVDLLIGQNSLVARVYDALNQPGPDSSAVLAYYDLVPTQAGPVTALNFGSSQMVLSTDAVFRGTFPGEQLAVPVQILGGVAPYAINIQWNDGTSSTLPHGDNTTFTMSHTYQKAGTYRITIQATDSTGRVAFLVVAAIVNGQPAAAAANSGTTSGSGTSGKLVMLWPLYSASFAVVLSFWLGERREKHVLAGRPVMNGIQYHS